MQWTGVHRRASRGRTADDAKTDMAARRKSKPGRNQRPRGGAGGRSTTGGLSRRFGRLRARREMRHRRTGHLSLHVHLLLCPVVWSTINSELEARPRLQPEDIPRVLRLLTSLLHILECSFLTIMPILLCSTKRASSIGIRTSEVDLPPTTL